MSVQERTKSVADRRLSFCPEFPCFLGPCACLYLFDFQVLLLDVADNLHDALGVLGALDVLGQALVLVRELLIVLVLLARLVGQGLHRLAELFDLFELLLRRRHPSRELVLEVAVLLHQLPAPRLPRSRKLLEPAQTRDARNADGDVSSARRPGQTADRTGPPTLPFCVGVDLFLHERNVLVGVVQQVVRLLGILVVGLELGRLPALLLQPALQLSTVPTSRRNR